MCSTEPLWSFSILRIQCSCPPKSPDNTGGHLWVLGLCLSPRYAAPSLSAVFWLVVAQVHIPDHRSHLLDWRFFSLFRLQSPEVTGCVWECSHEPTICCVVVGVCTRHRWFDSLVPARNNRTSEHWILCGIWYKSIPGCVHAPNE